jgi:hypothetical protein
METDRKIPDGLESLPYGGGGGSWGGPFQKVFFFS